MLTGKWILQEVSKLNCGWDEVVPTAFAEKWKEWLKDLNLISNFMVKRCFKPPNFEVSGAQLHHFCDAIEQGYSTANYLKLTSTSRQPHIAFVMGKTRVAPLKVVTIPRLELAAAVLASQIDRMLKERARVNPQRLSFGAPLFWNTSWMTPGDFRPMWPTKCLLFEIWHPNLNAAT